MENDLKCGFPWAEDMNCAVTVCDKEGTIIYMNSKSRATFCKDGSSLIGSNLFECHPEHARQKIRHMLATGESNSYTITTAKGVVKMIYQTPWRRPDGTTGGLVEISMPLPGLPLPHYNR